MEENTFPAAPPRIQRVRRNANSNNNNLNLSAILAEANNNTMNVKTPNNNNNSNVNTNYPRNTLAPLCGHRISKRILETELHLKQVIVSPTMISQGSFGKVMSAGIEYTEGTSTARKRCTAALKLSKAPHTELPWDVLREVGTYALTQADPCLAKALFMRFDPAQIQTVMNHYIMDLFTLSQEFLVGPVRQSAAFESICKAILVQVLTGIAKLNEHSIVHRDIKLENVFLAKDGTVSVADFGLMAHIPANWSSFQKGLQSFGTPEYMPPEAHTRQGNATNFDTWSVGVLLAYLIQDTVTFHDAFTSLPKGSPFEKYERRFSKLKRTLMQHIDGERLAKRLAISPLCLNFLDTCLELDWDVRTYAEGLLNDPWLRGMTAVQGQEILRKELESITSRTEGVRVRNVSRKIKRGSPTIPPAGAAVDNFFLIRTAEKTGSRWTFFEESAAISMEMYHLGLSEIMTLHGRYPHHSLPVLLHAIELSERLMKVFPAAFRDELDYRIITYCCYSIAAKLDDSYKANPTPASKFSLLDEAAQSVVAMPADRCKHMEEAIVKGLNGDIHAEAEGLCAQILSLLDAALVDETNPAHSQTRVFALWLVLYALLKPAEYGKDLATLWAATEKLYNLMQGKLSVDDLKDKEESILRACRAAATRYDLQNLVYVLFPVQFFVTHHPSIRDGGTSVFGGSIAPPAGAQYETLTKKFYMLFQNQINAIFLP